VTSGAAAAVLQRKATAIVNVAHVIERLALAKKNKKKAAK